MRIYKSSSVNVHLQKRFSECSYAKKYSRCITNKSLLLNSQLFWIKMLDYSSILCEKCLIVNFNIPFQHIPKLMAKLKWPTLTIVNLALIHRTTNCPFLSSVFWNLNKDFTNIMASPYIPIPIYPKKILVWHVHPIKVYYLSINLSSTSINKAIVYFPFLGCSFTYLIIIFYDIDFFALLRSSSFSYRTCTPSNAL